MLPNWLSLCDVARVCESVLRTSVLLHLPLVKAAGRGTCCGFAMLYTVDVDHCHCLRRKGACYLGWTRSEAQEDQSIRVIAFAIVYISMSVAGYKASHLCVL